MRNRVLFVLSFVWLCACNGCTRNTGLNGQQPVGNRAYATIAKRLVPFLSPEIEEKYSSRIQELKSIPDDPNLSEVLDAAGRVHGLEGIRQVAFEHGYFVSPSHTIPLGVFSITSTKGAVVEVHEAFVFGELPERGFAVFSAIGAKQILALSSAGLVDTRPFDETRKVEIEKNRFENAEWPEGLLRAARDAGSAIAQTRYYSDCQIPQKQSLRAAFVETFSKRLEEFGSRSIGKSTPEIAKEFGSVFGNSECPWLVLHVLGWGLSPELTFDGNNALTAARIAFLGEIAAVCGKDNNIVVDRFPMCAWHYLMTVDMQSFRHLLMSLGSNPIHWNYGLAVYRQYVDYVADFKAVISNVMAYGFQDSSWFDKLGIKLGRIPRYVSFTVSRYNPSSGTWTVPATMQFDFSTRSVPMPVVTSVLAAQQPGLLDNCAVPVLEETEWWRVCP